MVLVLVGNCCCLIRVSGCGISCATCFVCWLFSFVCVVLLCLLFIVCLLVIVVVRFALGEYLVYDGGVVLYIS